MTLTWLPGADRSQTFPASGTMTDTAHYKGLLHTMESMGWPGYNNGGEAPHVGVQPIRGVGVKLRQHIPFTAFAKALVNAPGGVQTNRDGALQFELMGTCDERHQDDPAWYFWPDADDAVLLDLYRKVIHPVSVAFDISESAPTFLAYKKGQVGGSYGATSVRFSGAEWDDYRGWCGHQHVPENWHGDPGLFPWARMMALAAKAGLTRPAQPGPSRGTLRPPLTDTDPARVKRLQSLLELTADGKWGAGTDEWALRLRTAARAKVGFPVNAVQPFNVRAVQGVLDVTADGAWGPKSQAALQAWVRSCQDVLGTTKDGSWGPGTDKAFLALRAANRNRY